MRIALGMQLTRLSLASGPAGQAAVSSHPYAMLGMSSHRVLNRFRQPCRLHSSLPSLSAFFETDQRSYASPMMAPTATSYRDREPQAEDIGEVDYESSITNSVSLLGRTGRDFERVPLQGYVLARSTLAVKAKKDTTDWFDIEVWGQLAEAAMQKLPKGSLIRVEGKLRSREWTEKATGDKRKAFAVVATALQRVRAAEPSAFPQQSYYSSNYQAGVQQQQQPYQQQQQQQQQQPPQAPWDEVYTAGQDAFDSDQGYSPVYPVRSMRDDFTVQGGGGGGGPAHQQQQQQQQGTRGQAVLDKWGRFMSSPSEYFDNRFSKTNPRAPDFKHKTTKEVLWLDNKDTPAEVHAWVAENLGSR